MFIPSISNAKKTLLCFLLVFIIMSLAAQVSPRAKVIAKSALIPGWGQLSIDKSRGYVFLADEILLFSGLYYFTTESDIKQTKAYDIALQSAHISPGDYTDDQLVLFGKYTTNGFDVNGYNTKVRQDAIANFPGDPTAQQAYFDDNMIPDSQGWNWDSNDKRQEYRKVRKESLDLEDYAKVVTGMIIANHLVNLIDIARSSAHPSNLKVGFGVSPNLTPQLKFALKY